MAMTDVQWAALAPLVEACRPRSKRSGRDLRRTLDGILWRHRNGGADLARGTVGVWTVVAGGAAVHPLVAAGRLAASAGAGAGMRRRARSGAARRVRDPGTPQGGGSAQKGASSAERDRTALLAPFCALPPPWGVPGSRTRRAAPDRARRRAPAPAADAPSAAATSGGTAAPPATTVRAPTVKRAKSRPLRWRQRMPSSVRRRSRGGRLLRGRHASTKGARAAHCASVIAIGHLPLIQSGNGRTTIWFRG